MAPRPTPEATRRDGVAAHSIRLADGNVWGLALPSVRLSPKFAVTTDEFGRNIEQITIHAGFGHPAAIERLTTAVRTASERGTAEEQYDAFFALAAKLLMRAHEIDSDAALELLAVDDGELPTLVRAVLSVAAGEERRSSIDPRGDMPR